MNCYVLIGGRSRRMGVAKAPIPFGGSTFLDRVAGAAAAVFDRVVAVQRAGEPAADSAAIAATIFESPHEDEAPIFGVAEALRDAKAKCFIVALDYPLITAAILGDLAVRWEKSPATMLLPVRRGHPQFLCAGYSAALLDRVESRIASREYDLKSLARGAELVDNDAVELMNVNTHEDLEEARRAYERQEFLPSR